MPTGITGEFLSPLLNTLKPALLHPDLIFRMTPREEKKTKILTVSPKVSNTKNIFSTSQGKRIFQLVS